MKLKNLLPVLFVLLCATNAALAATCFRPNSLKKALRWADVVFVGKIVSEEQVAEKEKTFMVYKLKVEKAWKGVSEKELIVADFYEALSYRNGLMVGQRYLIFADYKSFRGHPMELYDIYVDKNGKAQPVIDLCSWTAKLEYLPGEKKILRKLGKPKLIFDEFKKLKSLQTAIRTVKVVSKPPPFETIRLL